MEDENEIKSLLVTSGREILPGYGRNNLSPLYENKNKGKI